MSNTIPEAKQQFAALQSSLSPARAATIAQRLQYFEQQAAPARTASAAPAVRTELLFLTRPGAPPRPLPSTLFSLKNDELPD